MSCSELTTKIGKTLLFIGNECHAWTINDFVRAARNARAMGIDTIVPKRADGMLRWFANLKQIEAERQATLDQGCGYIPFIYSYGPQFGEAQIAGECTLLAELQDANDGMVVCDMEVEWNGRSDAAERFTQYVRQHPQHTLIVTTWADPIQQNWQGVIRALLPAVTAWWPQQYSTWLAAQTHQFIDLGATCIHPCVDLLGEFGANDPLNIASSAMAAGHTSLGIWEYISACQNPTLVRAITAVMGKHLTSTQPVTLPNPPETSHPKIQWKHYTLLSGDTLGSIAQKLHIANWYQDLYLPNAAMLNRIAQAHGYPDSRNGSLIFPGTELIYPVVSV